MRITVVCESCKWGDWSDEPIKACSLCGGKVTERGRTTVVPLTKEQS